MSLPPQVQKAPKLGLRMTGGWQIGELGWTRTSDQWDGEPG